VEPDWLLPPLVTPLTAAASELAIEEPRSSSDGSAGDGKTELLSATKSSPLNMPPGTACTSLLAGCTATAMEGGTSVGAGGMKTAGRVASEAGGTVVLWRDMPAAPADPPMESPS